MCVERCRWGSGAHAPPGPVDLRKPTDMGLSVAEGGKCDRGGRCMCAASFMPSEGGIILWLLALLCVSVVSAPQISDCFLFSIRKMRSEKLATLFAGRRPRFPPTAKLG